MCLSKPIKNQKSNEFSYKTTRPDDDRCVLYEKSLVFEGFGDLGGEIRAVHAMIRAVHD